MDFHTWIRGLTKYVPYNGDGEPDHFVVCGHKMRPNFGDGYYMEIADKIVRYALSEGIDVDSDTVYTELNDMWCRIKK